MGGALYHMVRAPIFLSLSSFTFLWSALSAFLTDMPQILQEKGKDLWKKHGDIKKETKTGFHFVWDKMGMRNLFIFFGGINFLLAPFAVLLPFYVEDHLRVDPVWFGAFIASFGLGVIFGYFFASLTRCSEMRSTMIVGMLFLMSIALGALGLVRTPLLSAALIFISGTVNGFVNIHIITILQMSTRANFRGRVLGFLSMVTGGLAPIAMGIARVITDMVNKKVHLIYILCGSATTLLIAVFSCNREFREYLASGNEVGSVQL